jgi:hypothetical protein
LRKLEPVTVICEASMPDWPGGSTTLITGKSCEKSAVVVPR